MLLCSFGCSPGKIQFMPIFYSHPYSAATTGCGWLVRPRSAAKIANPSFPVPHCLHGCSSFAWTIQMKSPRCYVRLLLLQGKVKELSWSFFVVCRSFAGYWQVFWRFAQCLADAQSYLRFWPPDKGLRWKWILWPSHRIATSGPITWLRGLSGGHISLLDVYRGLQTEGQAVALHGSATAALWSATLGAARRAVAAEYSELCCHCAEEKRFCWKPTCIYLVMRCIDMLRVMICYDQSCATLKILGPAVATLNLLILLTRRLVTST